MVVCFEKKFLFDPKGNFKNVEIEAKNGDLGLENGYGSKRSLFVMYRRLCGRRRRAALHHHQETFDTDVLALSGIEELELTFRDFHDSSETGMVMIGLMSPGTSMMLIM